MSQIFYWHGMLLETYGNDVSLAGEIIYGLLNTTNSNSRSKAVLDILWIVNETRQALSIILVREYLLNSFKNCKETYITTNKHERLPLKTLDLKVNECSRCSFLKMCIFRHLTCIMYTVIIMIGKGISKSVLLQF